MKSTQQYKFSISARHPLICLIQACSARVADNVGVVRPGAQLRGSRGSFPLFVWVFFRHAGVYTAEEVALIMREKLIRLQSLYIDQFKRLQHLLKEKKRRYLHSRKGEHEAIGK